MRKIRLLMAVSLLVLPVAAHADDHLTKARDLFARMKYAQALWHVDQIVKSDKSGPEQLVEAYQTRGFCLAGLGKKKLAMGAFRALLAIDPEFQLDARVSPKFRPTFDAARKRAAKDKPIKLVHKLPPPGGKPAGLKLEVTLAGNPMRLVRSLRLHYETLDGSSGQRTRRVKKRGSYTLQVPTDVDSPAISYRFEALNRYGAVLHRLGNRVEPFRYPPEEQPAVAAAGGGDEAGAGPDTTEDPADSGPDLSPPPPTPPATMATADLGGQDENGKEEEDGVTPWYQTWWFWTGVGVVVAGATTGIIIGASSGGGGDGIRYDVSLR